MTESQISADEMKKVLEIHFSQTIGNLVCYNYTLEKRIASQEETIREMSDTVKMLKAELANKVK